MNLSDFNSLTHQERERSFLKICHSKRWAESVNKQAPFNNVEDLFKTMTELWQSIEEPDLIEAISAHPRIGDINLLKTKFSEQANKEQGQVALASDELIAELYNLNQQYFERFGFIFLICASGKSPEYMCRELKNRLNNSRKDELEIAQTEQNKISLLRIKQLLEFE
jgi:2-oxo-4-hydroxy-4-carboxy-5-ureidoimidazoline decarboxylase